MSPRPETEQKDEVIVVKDGQGALSLELMPLREGVARGFLHASPRNMKLSEASRKKLRDELESRPYSRVLVLDNKRRLLRSAFQRSDWRLTRAIPTKVSMQCSMMTTYDLPMDDSLFDAAGMRVDTKNTDHMHGIEVDFGARKAWAFYTEDGTTARIISEPERKLGMMVASNADDFEQLAGCLLEFLAMANKSWAVFSIDMGRYIRKYEPMMMWRMVLERPTGFQHSAQPVSNRNKREAVRMFSEYYDETKLESMLRLRRMRSDATFSIFLVDGGFVITRLEGDTGLIFDIYVTPGRQGEGLGSELMKCAITQFAGRVSSCYLHTSYPRAKRLYEKFGFKTVYSQLGIRLEEVVVEPPRSK